MNDDFLTKFRKEPRPEFASELYQRINKPMQTRSKQLGFRFAALTLSLLAIFTVTLLLSPSARALAQGLLVQIGGYAFNLGEPQPADASRVPAPINIVRSSNSVSIEITNDAVTTEDPVAAGDLAGFTVLVPSYLPSGYIAMDGNWLVTTENNGTAVTNGYFDTTKNFFLVTQWKFGEGDPVKAYTREEIVDVTVHGQSGLWLPDPASPHGNNALVWEENGITYSIITNSLSLDETLKVSESMGQ